MTTAKYKRAVRSLGPEDVVLTALEIRHQAIADPIRVVNDSVDHVIGGQRFVALRFTAAMVDDDEGSVPRAVLAVDNVGAALTQWIERSGGAPARRRE